MTEITLESFLSEIELNINNKTDFFILKIHKNYDFIGSHLIDIIEKIEISLKITILQSILRKI